MRDIEGQFFLGKADSRDHDAILTEPPPYVAPMRDVEKISVPGRSGDLVFDIGRYCNVSVPYRCAIVPKGGRPLRDCAVAVVNAFPATAHYQRLQNCFDPGHYRMARVSKSISVESIVERAGRFTLEFDCMPQRWLVDGERCHTYTAVGKIYCPTGQSARPLITVYGSGKGTITVGDATVEIREITDVITLDSDTQNAYRQLGDGGAENKNSCIYAPEFPVLLPGENPVYFDGGITKIEIIPRWWEL